jgi:hypothetical protein
MTLGRLQGGISYEEGLAMTRRSGLVVRNAFAAQSLGIYARWLLASIIAEEETFAGQWGDYVAYASIEMGYAELYDAHAYAFGEGLGGAAKTDIVAANGVVVRP